MGCDLRDSELMFDNERADDGFKFGRVSSSWISPVEYLFCQGIGISNEFFCFSIHRKRNLLEN